jgi:putative addiction module component (TIGR02574 family)
MAQPINIADIKALSIPERILLVEEIWDSIAAEQEAIPVTDAQRDDLDRRIARSDASPGEGEAWETLKQRLQR